MATRLTEKEIQNLDPETACTLACLRQSRYYWKDQKYFLEHGLSEYRGMEPTVGFIHRVNKLVSESIDVTLVDDDVLQFTVPENAPSECPYRRVSEQETDDLQAKLPNSIKAGTLEPGPDCPPLPDNMRPQDDFV